MAPFLTRTETGRCPACGAAHTACGPPSGAVPFDTHTLEVATVSGPLTKYRYRGTVLKLNDTDAARLGLTDADVVGAPAPAAAEAVVETEAAQQPAEVKALAGSSNKARTTAANKGGRRAKPAPSAAAPVPDSDQGDAAAGGDQGDGAADGGGDGGPGGGD